MCKRLSDAVVTRDARDEGSSAGDAAATPTPLPPPSSLLQTLLLLLLQAKTVSKITLVQHTHRQGEGGERLESVTEQVREKARVKVKVKCLPTTRTTKET